MAEERSAAGRVWDYLKERVGPEVGQMIDHKVAQGAAELAQALNSQADGYVPYGAGQKPLEVEGPAVNYQQMLREASSREAPEQDRGMDR